MRRRMTREHMPVATNGDGQHAPSTGVYRLTDWKCVNWHHLLTLPGPSTGADLTRIEGDVFNLGPNESGKSTWLDGLHAALTLGKAPYMEWNSASDPSASATRLREKGRSILDIIFRETLKGPMRAQPVIVYFSFEARNDQTGEVQSIGVGAWASSPKAEPDIWGFTYPRPLSEVDLKDANHVFDRSELEDRLGKANVHSLPRFRQRIADLFYGGHLRDYDRVLAMLNLSKSYPRLAEKSEKFSDLFRRALPAPDPSHIAEARSDIAKIQQLEERIKDAQHLAGDLEKILDAVDSVRRNQVLLRRYAYRQAHDLHADAKTTLDALTEQTGNAQEALAKALAARETAEVSHRNKHTLLLQLASKDDEDLVRKAEAAHREATLAEEAQTRSKKELDEAKAREADAASKASKAWEGLSQAAAGLARSLQDAAKDLPSWVTPDIRTNLLSHVEALAKLAPADATLPRILAETQQRFTESADHQRRQAERAALEARVLKERAATNLDELKERRRIVAAQADVPPPGYEGLDYALKGLQDKVIVCYRGMESRADRAADATLLEAYLPPQILAAVIPRNPADYERIRTHLRRRIRRVKVVDTSNIPLSLIPIPEALVRCLSEETDPLVRSWLDSQYGDVARLEKDAPRGTRPRVVWETGDVYDGHAWHLENETMEPRFLGSRAREANKQRLLREIDTNIQAVDGERQKHARAEQEAVTRETTIEKLKRQVGQAINRADLPSSFLALNSRRQVAAAARSQVEREQRLWNRAKDERDGRNHVLKELTAELQRTGADARHSRYQLAVQEEEKARTHLTNCGEAVGGARTHHDEVAQKAKLAATNEGEAGAVLSTRRAELFELAVSERFDEASFDKYLAEKQVFAIKPGNLPTLIEKAQTDRGAALKEIELRVAEVSPRKSLQYDPTTNAVTHLGVPLSTEHKKLKQDLEADRLKHAHEVSESAKKVFVLGIASGLKVEDARMQETIEGIRKILQGADFRGATFEVVAKPIRARDANTDAERQEYQDKAQMRALVLETDESSDPTPLGRFMIERFRALPSSRPDEVPPLFDYRHWYEFTIKRNDVADALAKGSEPDSEELPDVLTKASGGGKAIPRYLLCFALFKLLYDSIGARLRLVLLDEAFEAVDPKNIDALLQAAKTMGLTLVVNNPKLAGATEYMGANTTYMFSKDNKEQTWILPWRQSARREATA